MIYSNYQQLITDCISFSYNDPITGKSPDIEFTIIDRGIIPIAIGAQVSIEIGSNQGPYRLDAGIFEVDRLVRRDRQWEIGATGLPLGSTAFTRDSREADYADFLLADILQEIADRYNLSLFTPSLPDIEFSQLLQNESDLEFLNKLAVRLGSIFKIENNQLIFTSLIELEKRSPIFAIAQKDLIKSVENIISTNLYQFLDYGFGDNEILRVEDSRVANNAIARYTDVAANPDDSEALLAIAASEYLRKINGSGCTFSVEIPYLSSAVAGSVFLLDGRPIFCDRVTSSFQKAEGKTAIVGRLLPYLF